MLVIKLTYFYLYLNPKMAMNCVTQFMHAYDDIR